MRILIVHNFYRLRGGEDSVVLNEIELLKAGGIDVDLYSVDSQNLRSFQQKLVAGIRIIYNMKARRELARKLRAFKPDVVHVHNFFPLLSSSILDACMAENIPCVATLHNYRLVCPTALLLPEKHLQERSLVGSCWWTVPIRAYNNSLFATAAVAMMVEWHKKIGTWRRKVTTFVALSEEARQKFILAGFRAEQIVVKPNSVERSCVVPEARREGALFVGRLDEQKGITTLLKSWEGVDYPLRIVGDGPLEHEIRANSNPHITWCGRLPKEDVRKEMARARFLILPSTGHEMFPLTVLEAYSCGLPVIASDLSSLRGLVKPGRTGLVFSPGNPVALREAVLSALRNPDQLVELGANALLAYQTDYTPEVNLRILLSIYASVVHRSGRTKTDTVNASAGACATDF